MDSHLQKSPSLPAWLLWLALPGLLGWLHTPGKPPWQMSDLGLAKDSTADITGYFTQELGP